MQGKSIIYKTLILGELIKLYIAQRTNVCYNIYKHTFATEYITKGGPGGGGYRLHKKQNQRNNHRTHRGRKRRSNKIYN